MCLRTSFEREVALYLLIVRTDDDALVVKGGERVRNHLRNDALLLFCADHTGDTRVGGVIGAMGTIAVHTGVSDGVVARSRYR